MRLCEGCARRVGISRVETKGEGTGGEAALVRLARGQGAVDAEQELGRQQVQQRRDDEEAVCSPGRQLSSYGGTS